MSTTQRLDAVLPIIAQDMERFALQRQSFEKFYRIPGTLFMVAPDSQCDGIRPKLPTDGVQDIELIPESELVPEFADFPKLSGWYKQQIIKFAIHQRVTTDFYLTLDGDVLCCQPVEYEDLIQNGRAMARRTQQNLHPLWYEWAKRVLNLEPSGVTHGVTPAVFSRAAVEKLTTYLAKRTEKHVTLANAVLPQSLLGRRKAGWKHYLMRNTPWTEYSLYNTYLEATNQLWDHHFDGGQYAIYHHSVWQKEAFEKWDPAKAFTEEGNFFFCVVQSNTGTCISEVRDRVDCYLCDDKAPATEEQNPGAQV